MQSDAVGYLEKLLQKKNLFSYVHRIERLCMQNSFHQFEMNYEI